MSNLEVGKQLREMNFAINLQELKDNFTEKFKELDELIKEAMNKLPETTRASEIKHIIDFRLKDNDYVKCLFSVLILDKSVKKSVEELLRRYNHDDGTVDTIPGCWCLNDDWYEFQEDAIIEYGGVYPIHWNLGDIIYLEELYRKRKIYINVHYKLKDEWVQIH